MSLVRLAREMGRWRMTGDEICDCQLLMKVTGVAACKRYHTYYSVRKKVGARGEERVERSIESNNRVDGSHSIDAVTAGDEQ